MRAEVTDSGHLLEAFDFFNVDFVKPLSKVAISVHVVSAVAQVAVHAVGEEEREHLHALTLELVFLGEVMANRFTNHSVVHLVHVFIAEGFTKAKQVLTLDGAQFNESVICPVLHADVVDSNVAVSIVICLAC